MRSWISWTSRARCCPRSARPASLRHATATPWAGVPVCGDLGDQQAALVGQTCFGVGEAKNTYGTGCFMLLNTGTTGCPSKHGLLTTVAYKLGDEPAVYALEGSIAITGALVQWLRDNLGFFDFSQHVEDYARHGARQRRHLFRAGLLRPVRALLAGRRPRRHRRADALHQQGPHLPRRAGGHRLPDARSAGRHGAGFRRAADRAQG